MKPVLVDHGSDRRRFGDLMPERFEVVSRRGGIGGWPGGGEVPTHRSSERRIARSKDSTVAGTAACASTDHPYQSG
jgi:hypothetical protein